jgi:hypothetical protein
MFVESNMSKKKLVNEHRTINEVVECGISINRVIAELEQLKCDLIQQGCPEEHILLDLEGYGYEGGADLVVKFKRPETDSELQRRVKKEKAERERKKERDRKKKEKELREYERLKKKYG